MICECERPLTCPDSAECLKCGRSSVPRPDERPAFVSVPIDEYDALLTYRRRLGYVARAQ